MRLLRNIFLLLLPYLIMVIINEAYRLKIEEKPYIIYGITAINSDIRSPEKCSWIAHSNTNYCKEHHVKFLKDHLQFTDRIYYSAIGALHATGNYSASNVIFLVILFPFIIWYSLVKIVDYTIAIRNLKKQVNGKS